MKQEPLGPNQRFKPTRRFLRLSAQMLRELRGGFLDYAAAKIFPIEPRWLTGAIAVMLITSVIEVHQVHLDGPLLKAFWQTFPLLAYLSAFLLAAAFPPGSFRWMAVVVAVVAFNNIAYLDRRFARTEFEALCEKLDGIKVVKTVSLPDDQILQESGLPIFYLKGARDSGLNEAGYTIVHLPSQRHVMRWGVFYVVSLELTEIRDSAVLARWNFVSWGGGGPPGIVRSPAWETVHS